MGRRCPSCVREWPREIQRVLSIKGRDRCSNTRVVCACVRQLRGCDERDAVRVTTRVARSENRARVRVQLGAPVVGLVRVQDRVRERGRRARRERHARGSEAVEEPERGVAERCEVAHQRRAVARKRHRRGLSVRHAQLGEKTNRTQYRESSLEGTRASENTSPHTPVCVCWRGGKDPHAVELERAAARLWRARGHKARDVRRARGR